MTVSNHPFDTVTGLTYDCDSAMIDDSDQSHSISIAS